MLTETPRHAPCLPVGVGHRIERWPRGQDGRATRCDRRGHEQRAETGPVPDRGRERESPGALRPVGTTMLLSAYIAIVVAGGGAALWSVGAPDPTIGWLRFGL